MADFSKKIKNRYGIRTYQDVKNTYDWIEKALRKGGFADLRMNARFLFNLSEITCSCEGIEEFVENAYGQADFDLTNMMLSVYDGDAYVAHIQIGFDSQVRISTGSRVLLEKIVGLLEKTELNETEANDPISVTYVETEIHSGGVLIQGDHNTAANDHSAVTVSPAKEKESKGRQWLTGIVQSLVSNGIWYLLCAAVGAAIALWAAK